MRLALLLLLEALSRLQRGREIQERSSILSELRAVLRTWGGYGSESFQGQRSAEGHYQAFC